MKERTITAEEQAIDAMLAEAPTREETYHDALRGGVEDALATVDDPDAVDFEALGALAVAATNKHITAHNATVPKDMRELRWKGIKRLTPIQVATIIHRLVPYGRIIETGQTANIDLNPVLFYVTDGPRRGLYAYDDEIPRRLIRALDDESTAQSYKETMRALAEMAPTRKIGNDPDLVFCNNCIVNRRTKEVLDFSPEYVATSKLATDFNPDAEDPVIHNDEDGTDWTVEGGVLEIAGTDEIRQSIWWSLYAGICGRANFDQALFYYSERGRNGKGTIAALLREVIGEDNCSPLTLAEFSGPRAMTCYATIIDKFAVIADENPVGTYIDGADLFKAAVTHEPRMAKILYQQEAPAAFHGTIIQCLNEFPRVSDKSPSFLRRLHFIPFNNCFTGRDRKYIKHDYIKRKEVREYVLKKVLLDMPYTNELPESAASKAVKARWRTENDSVIEFVEAFLADGAESAYTIDFIPWALLYAHFKAWLKETNGTAAASRPVGSKRFITAIRTALEDGLAPSWHFDANNNPQTVGDRMDMTEPIVELYGLTEWQCATGATTGTHAGYIGLDPSKVFNPSQSPRAKARMTGIWRD